MSNKDGDLWDDSALINAFDRTIAKYKLMHGVNTPSNTSETGDLADAEGAVSTSMEVAEPTETESSDSKPNDSYYTVERNGISQNNGSIHEECPHIQENQPDQELRHEECPHIQENQPDQELNKPCHVPGATEGYDSYRQLLQHYFELEEQKVKILQQLSQSNYWNDQFPFPSSSYLPSQVSHFDGSVGGTSLPSVPSSQQYFCHPEICTMCRHHFGYQDSHAPWSSALTSSQLPTGSQQISGDSQRPGSTSNNAEAAVTQAERGISSLDLDSSSGSAPHKDGKCRNETQDTITTSDSHNVNSDADLSCALGAWYTAGFYTGRYLLGQSSKRGT